MDCDTASELMPWLLNRTLSSEEAEGVARHVAGCDACRREMEETRRAAAVFAAHLPPDTILDLAAGRDVPGDAVARRHAEQCADCAEELALAREGLAALEAPAAAAPAARRPPSRVARWVALPATLAAGLVIGLALPRAQPTVVPTPDPGLGVLRDENARLRESVAALRAEAEAARAPDVNLPFFEVLSGGVTRGAPGGGNDLAVPEGARRLALLLVADVPAGTEASLAILAADGRTVWQADGLRSTALGAYGIAVPADLMPAGRYVLVLRPRGAARVEYQVRVRPAR